ncbi:MAG: VanW family protein, partial [Atribacterota bacterium]
MRLPWKTLLILGVAGFFICTLFGFLLIKPGDVTVLGKELHGLRRSEVAPFLQITEKEWMEVPLEIQVQNKTFTIDKKALSLQWDISRMKNDALHLPNGAVPITFLWDDGKVNRVFSFITEKINRPPQNASWSSHQMTPSRPGMQLNLAQTLEQMRSAISQGQSTIRLHSFDLIPPAVGTSVLLKAQRIPYLLSHHETSLLEKDEKTRFNIQKAADTLSGIIVEKGYPFSFNQVVGPAEKKDGYLETKVVVNGKLIPGYGGGVCQVSSTLYNALLKTDAKIIERSPHSGYFPTTSYVLPGLDAAVSDGFKDLRFTFP